MPRRRALHTDKIWASKTPITYAKVNRSNPRNIIPTNTNVLNKVSLRGGAKRRRGNLYDTRRDCFARARNDTEGNEIYHVCYSFAGFSKILIAYE